MCRAERLVMVHTCTKTRSIILMSVPRAWDEDRHSGSAQTAGLDGRGAARQDLDRVADVAPADLPSATTRATSAKRRASSFATSRQP
jgi:hypothetical protein